MYIHWVCIPHDQQFSALDDLCSSVTGRGLLYPSQLFRLRQKTSLKYTKFIIMVHIHFVKKYWQIAFLVQKNFNFIFN